MSREDAIVQNLRDAGCDADFIEDFLACYRDRKAVEQMRLLTQWRRALLHHIHDDQKKLDCLDYLIHELKKEHKQNDI